MCAGHFLAAVVDIQLDDVDLIVFASKRQVKPAIERRQGGRLGSCLWELADDSEVNRTGIVIDKHFRDIDMFVASTVTHEGDPQIVSVHCRQGRSCPRCYPGDRLEGFVWLKRRGIDRHDIDGVIVAPLQAT